jgi:hypothetical protein
MEIEYVDPVAVMEQDRKAEELPLEQEGLRDEQRILPLRESRN